MRNKVQSITFNNYPEGFLETVLSNEKNLTYIKIGTHRIPVDEVRFLNSGKFMVFCKFPTDKINRLAFLKRLNQMQDSDEIIEYNHISTMRSYF